MTCEARHDHTCLICSNSCCSPLRRSGWGFSWSSRRNGKELSLFGEGEGDGDVRVEEWSATAGIQEPQGEDGLCRGKWHTLDFAEIGCCGPKEELCRNLSTLFHLHISRWSFLSLNIMILAVTLRKNCFPEIVLGTLL